MSLVEDLGYVKKIFEQQPIPEKISITIPLCDFSEIVKTEFQYQFIPLKNGGFRYPTEKVDIYVYWPMNEDEEE